jgi:TolC family type I secretion outer membrane protein
VLLATGVTRPAVAADPFRTDAELRRETAGLTDPGGGDCPVPEGALTFAGAVDLALCRNPRTRSAWASAHAQAAALGSATSAWVPNVSLSGAQQRAFGQHVDLSGNFSSSAQNTGDATINLNWTLYDFGARSARIRSARSLLEAAAATVSSVAQQTVAQVVQSYYGVVAGDAQLGAAKITEEVTAHSLEIARSLREGGVGTLADVLQAETAHEQAVLAALQASVSAASARGTLAVSLGLSADQGFVLAAEPIPAELPALTARIADLMAEAARQRPDLKAAEAQRDAAQANVAVARAVGRPTITLGALHSVQSTTGLPNENYDQVGLSFNWPIFSGFSTSYGIREAQAGLQAQEANLQQAGLNVTLDVWNAYHTLNSANRQLGVTADLTKTASDNLDVALGRYKAGVGTIVDVLTAQTAAATARQYRINAELGWKVARAQFSLALGRLSSAEPMSDDLSMP